MSPQRRSSTSGRALAPARRRRAAALLLLALLALAPAGCRYESNEALTAAPEGTFDPGLAGNSAAGMPATPVAPPTPTGPGATTTAASPSPSPSPSPADDASTEKAAILDNIIKQIQTAATNPGGDNFGIAIKNLNQYFKDTPEGEYVVPPPARAFLEPLINKARVDDLESRTWTKVDTRHVEDCMLYHGIAERVAGVDKDDLTRVRRLFDWMVRQVQLVPAGSLGSGQLAQAYARPYDVLLRGMATEAEGVWAERGWLFLVLCRQLGLDAGLVTYTPPGAKAPIVWCEAVLINKKAYLFDARIGLPIPDRAGTGVATLEEAMTDPLILDRLDLPGQSPYNTTAAALRSSTSKIGILLDSGSRYFSPRMRLLQQSLAGKNQTVLYRDPAAQRDHWAEVLGPHAGKVALWDLPMTVEVMLFTNPQFAEATLRSLIMFRPEFPLLYARMKQLRGETSEAIEDYVAFRFAENPTLMDRKTPMPPEVQKVLDIYATYFLGLSHLELNDPEKAAFFFEKTLQLVPEPGKGQPYFHMFRWGAIANLARLREAKGTSQEALRYYTRPDPTSQSHGNLLKARELLWPTPMTPPPPPLPPAPAPFVQAGNQTAQR